MYKRDNVAAFGRTHTRFKMLTRWLTFTAFLAGSANPGRAATGLGSLTVAPTCSVKGHLEAELTLNCGDEESLGVVQYWHTPFGDLQTPSLHSKLDPVYMHHDGSLVVPNASVLHSGLYYCLLQHTEGTTLWPYKLNVGHNYQNKQDGSKYEQNSNCARLRFRRDAGSEGEKQADVPDGLFAGAVAASVLLTFVLGFTVGALSRTHVLRCLGAVTAKLQAKKCQRRCQTDTTDRGPEVSMTSLAPAYENQAFENDQVMHEDSATFSTTTSPPAKPQRSFRHKREEEETKLETTAYLEGCDNMKREDKIEEEEEKNNESDGEAQGQEEEKEREFHGFVVSAGGSQSETDEDREDEDGSVSREEKTDLELEEEEAGEERNEEKDGETETCKDSETSSTETEDNERDGNSQDATATNKGGPSPSAPRPARRSRVIRLYQYDEDGQRYGHLPDTALDVPAPAPRLKQRSISLTRLGAIMAAASTGPLDGRETGRQENEDGPNFHMDM